MSNVPAADQRSHGTLRGDLSSVIVPGSRRSSRIIIDEVSGRFVRVAELVWQQLLGGIDDPELWQQAKAAGWTRERAPQAARRFSPLFFRIPVISIDSLARVLARVSGPVFSSTAIITWSIVIAAAVVVTASRSGQLLASLQSLPLFLEQANPIWLAGIFVATKVIHELAHAVMCRRMGARCGRIGLLMLCGVPCPYCDVTEVWRLPSATRRAAVMLAGIYVELILAALAAFVWAASTDTLLGLTALNVMVVCGISTLVFNANPLMRYDGYYVLADLVGSVNLRKEAQSAWHSVVTCRIAGDQYQAKAKNDRRTLLLSAYHAASTVYRVTIMIAIASFLIAVAALELRSVAIGLVMLAVVLAFVRLGRRWIGLIRGSGRWQQVPLWRRGVVASGLILVLLAIMLPPLPRFRRSDGYIDVAGATSVFLPVDGLVRAVGAEFGQHVDVGDRLVTLDNESLALEQTRLQGDLRVAKLRSNLSRRVTLDRVETAQQWETLQAAEDAVAVRLASTRKQLHGMQVAATSRGVVVPPVASVTLSDAVFATLRDREGTAASARNAWCRISHDGRLHAVFELDARDRAEIDVGSKVLMLCLTSSPERVMESTVASVSAIEKDEPSVLREATYRAVCPIPAVEDQEVLQWMGSECHGVFPLKSKSLAQDLAAWWSDWIHK